jgi:hypothetical protein
MFKIEQVKEIMVQNKETRASLEDFALMLLKRNNF